MAGTDEISGDLDSFKLDATTFSEIDNRIRELNEKLKPYTKELKELKMKKLELKKHICKFMEKNDLDKCALKEKNSVLLYQKRKVVIPLTREIIKNELVRFFGTYNVREFNGLTPEEKGNKIFEYIWEDRDYKYSETLLNKPL
jgi:uncharacterized protein YdcH (DUF465 family)